MTIKPKTPAPAAAPGTQGRVYKPLRPGRSRRWLLACPHQSSTGRTRPRTGARRHIAGRDPPFRPGQPWSTHSPFYRRRAGTTSLEFYLLRREPSRPPTQWVCFLFPERQESAAKYTEVPHGPRQVRGANQELENLMQQKSNPPPQNTLPQRGVTHPPLTSIRSNRELH